MTQSQNIPSRELAPVAICADVVLGASRSDSRSETPER
jgi:hypothetical protein